MRSPSSGKGQYGAKMKNKNGLGKGLTDIFFFCFAFLFFFCCFLFFLKSMRAIRQKSANMVQGKESIIVGVVSER